MGELVSTFDGYAPASERELSPRERYLNGRYEACNSIERWGDSLLGGDAVAHATATAPTINEQWWSQADPREVADDSISGLVRDIWQRVTSEGIAPHTQDVLPTGCVRGAAGEHPAGDRRAVLPVLQLARARTVPRGHRFAAAVRDEDVDDLDADQIVGLADPDGFEAETGHEHDVRLDYAGLTRPDTPRS